MLEFVMGRGVMYIFNKFSHLTNEFDYSETIEYWKNITIEMINSEKGKFITGHCAWNNERGTTTILDFTGT